jgi:hypothetical protein
MAMNCAINIVTRLKRRAIRNQRRKLKEKIFKAWDLVLAAA